MSHGDKARFVTTRWSLVLAAGHEEGTGARQALTTLCETYWYPVYAFVRRRGYAVEDAQDLTQAFFTRLLASDDLSAARRERGRFRSFLLTAVKSFLANEWHREQALKRGGGTRILALDFDEGERLWRREPSAEHTPETLFERRWALTLLERGLDVLRQEYEGAGKLETFERLKTYLTGEGDSYREVAAELGKTEGAVKVAVLRLRRSFGEVLRREIAETVGRPDEAEDELRHLLRTMSS